MCIRKILIFGHCIHSCIYFQIKLEGYEKDPLQNEEESNPLVLPSNKRKTKVKTFQEPKVKRLTKKERKRLEKVVERREKKAKVLDEDGGIDICSSFVVLSTFIDAFPTKKSDMSWLIRLKVGDEKGVSQ